jgi:hypothetical protein
LVRPASLNTGVDERLERLDRARRAAIAAHRLGELLCPTADRLVGEHRVDRGAKLGR